MGIGSKYESEGREQVGHYLLVATVGRDRLMEPGLQGGSEHSPAPRQ